MTNKLRCDCGKELTKEEIAFNEKAPKPRVNYCEDCWDAYCHHAITGE